MKKVILVNQVKPLKAGQNKEARFSLYEDRENNCVLVRPEGTTQAAIEAEFKGKKIISVEETRQDATGKDFQGRYFLKMFTADAIATDVQRDYNHQVAIAKAKELAANSVSLSQVNSVLDLVN